MLERFVRHIGSRGLLTSSDRVLVGYSGGADSTCLLALLNEAGFDVVAGHLHHSQREEADAEAVNCEAFCDSIGVPFATGQADVPGMARDNKIGLEEAGRKARYAFLESAAHQLGCTHIATAHTKDDLVETQLLNLSRGTGLLGLASIPEKRGWIIRPLLPFTKAETRGYCMERELWFHDDPANTDLSFSRARVRHRIVPEFLILNPAFLDSSFRLAATAGDEDRFLNGLAAAALEQCERKLNGALRFLSLDLEMAFERSKLVGLQEVLVKRAIRLGAEALGGSLDFEQTQLAVHGIASDSSGSVTAEGGEVVIEWSKDLVHLRNLVVDTPFRFPLTSPGETESPVFGWKFTVSTGPPDGFPKEPSCLHQWVDDSKVEAGMHLRSIEAGDSLVPLGMSGTKKVSDLLSEAGLTLAARRRLPIICDGAGPIWLPGIAVADRVKIDSGTELAVKIEFGPLELN